LDHLHAQQMNAPERYLLGELPPAEAEDFELHYFECQQCALAVESGEQFIACARAYYADPVTPKPRVGAQKPGRSFLQAVSAFLSRPVFAIPAMAALGALSIYQGAVVIPPMRSVLYTSRFLPAVQLLSASRGDEPVLSVSLKDPFAELKADIPPAERYPAEPYKEYFCDLTRGGSLVSTTLAPAPAEGQPVTIEFPVGQLKAGHHDLTLYGVKPDGQRSDKVSTYPFRVEFIK
jgi:hypothetical protein